MRKLAETCSVALAVPRAPRFFGTTPPQIPIRDHLLTDGSRHCLKQYTQYRQTAGNEVTVTLSDRTTYMRIPPGEKTKDKFVPIAATDFGVGDSVFARGRMSEDRKSMPALEFYVMSKADIAQKRERERDEWSKRGIGNVTV